MATRVGIEHGKSKTAEYRTWSNMRHRCANPKTIGFADYGARGIVVCERWRNSFEAFLADIGPKPSPQHSIDRIDNDGDYEPGNVRWALMTEQAANRKRLRRTETVVDVVKEFEWVRVAAPADFWRRLDRWRERTAKRKQMTMAPSRPASIRWIVHQFLLKQEQRAKRPTRRSK